MAYKWTDEKRKTIEELIRDLLKFSFGYVLTIQGFGEYLNSEEYETENEGLDDFTEWFQREWLSMDSTKGELVNSFIYEEPPFPGWDGIDSIVSLVPESRLGSFDEYLHELIDDYIGKLGYDGTVADYFRLLKDLEKKHGASRVKRFLWAAE
jgi:hypothetical protein